MRQFIAFLLSVTILCSCSKPCKVDFKEFQSNERPPIIHVTSRKSDCDYVFKGDFWIDRLQYSTTGELLVNDNAFYLVADSLSSDRVRYFDFNYKRGDQYEIELEPKWLNREVFKFSMKVDNTLHLGTDEIYLFRLSEGFWYSEKPLDVVFVVSKEHGIIGSYVSSEFEGQEIIAGVRGDILKDKIDYTNKTFGVLQ